MRLIDADALKMAFRTEKGAYVLRHAICNLFGMDEIVDEQPTIEAEPVVHGRWIPHNKGQNNWCECSECNTVGSPFWKRCPVCEAKMDGERESNGTGKE